MRTTDTAHGALRSSFELFEVEENLAERWGVREQA